MSEDQNIQLLERAVDVSYYYEGTLIAKVIAQDIARNDLESLRGHVLQAERMEADNDW